LIDACNPSVIGFQSFFQVPKIRPRNEPVVAAAADIDSVDSAAGVASAPSHHVLPYVHTSAAPMHPATLSSPPLESFVSAATSHNAPVQAIDATSAALHAQPTPLARSRQIAADAAASPCVLPYPKTPVTVNSAATPNLIALAAAAASSPVYSKQSMAAARAAADIDLVMAQVQCVYDLLLRLFCSGFRVSNRHCRTWRLLRVKPLARSRLREEKERERQLLLRVQN
jgi:hypothetical protein